MKLAYCPKCKDLFKLTRAAMRNCKCGRVKGRYLNKREAVISDAAISIVIGNGSLKDTIRRMKRWRKLHPRAPRGDYKKVARLTAWVRPNSGSGNPRSRILGKKKSTP